VRVNSFVFTNLAFDNQTFKVAVDTGSSDTWLVSSDFACIIKDIERPQAACEIDLLYDVEDGFVASRPSFGGDSQAFSWCET
jgi:Eukaryotic aspartyl protease